MGDSCPGGHVIRFSVGSTGNLDAGGDGRAI